MCKHTRLLSVDSNSPISAGWSLSSKSLPCPFLCRTSPLSSCPGPHSFSRRPCPLQPLLHLRGSGPWPPLPTLCVTPVALWPAQCQLHREYFWKALTWTAFVSSSIATSAQSMLPSSTSSNCSFSVCHSRLCSDCQRLVRKQ